MLPLVIQEKTRRAFKLWSEDSNHPSLHFEKIHSTDPIYSVRIDFQHRALDVKEGNTLVCFWIGTHEADNNLVSEL